MRAVFVVDDDKNLAKIMARTISTLVDNVEVRSFTDPILALGAATEHHPDVMVIDMMMPAMDGIQLVRELRRQGVTSETVMVTAYQTEAMANLLPSNGVSTVMFKPIPGMELAYKVQQALKKAASMVGANGGVR